MSAYSNKLWDCVAKKGSLIRNKTITISILKAIEPGLDSKVFTNLVEKQIYSELENIN